MGKGSNVSKTNRAREDAAKRAAQEGKGGGGADAAAVRRGAGALTTICQICRTSFMSQQTKEQLQAHVDSKHAKETFAKCFRACLGRPFRVPSAPRARALTPLLLPPPSPPLPSMLFAADKA
jgi:hypothetical protein